MALSRRELLRRSALLAGMLGGLNGARSYAAARDAGHWRENLPPPDPLLHLMNRASFGVTEAMRRQAPSSPQAWLEQQLDPLAIDDSAVDVLVARDFPGYLLPYPEQLVYYSELSSSSISRDQLMQGDADGMMQALGDQLQQPTTAPVSQRTNVGRMALDLQGASFYYQHYSTRQLREVMVDFWSNHFHVHLWADGQTRQFRPQEDRLVIRAHVLGNFEHMLQGSAASPAMLAYLDGNSNRKGRPNENYARELLELHTLGIEHYHPGSEETRPPGHYSEEDVRQVARCFTGWTYNKLGQLQFVPERHELGDKRVLGVTIAGREGLLGVHEGQEVLRLLARHEGTARHIARKLCERFISDSPPTATVNEVAASFHAGSGDIAQTLRTLFSSEGFAASTDEKFLRPLDFLHRLLRILEVELRHDPELRASTPPIWRNRIYLDFEREYLGKEGHGLFAWDTPDGYPQAAAYWANPNALLQRWRAAALLLENEAWRGFASLDLAALGEGRSGAALVDHLAARVLRRGLLAEDREQLIALALTPAPDPRGPLIAVLTAMLGSAYFQLF